jgi:DNA-binding transcriptional ArsR family regulator
VTVLTVRDGTGLQALAHPLRVRALEQLREPASAAEVARRLGEPRQKVNYHLKELVKAGLVREVGERRAGNFVETLYRSVADAFVVSPEVAWSDPRRTEAMRHQHSLEQLVSLGERLQRDAASLLDRAAFDGETIASASVVAEVGFSTEEDRAGFLRDYLAAMRRLTERYGSAGGTRYRVAAAAYPDPGEE